MAPKKAGTTTKKKAKVEKQQESVELSDINGDSNVPLGDTTKEANQDEKGYAQNGEAPMTTTNPPSGQQLTPDTETEPEASNKRKAENNAVAEEIGSDGEAKTSEQEEDKPATKKQKKAKAPKKEPATGSRKSSRSEKKTLPTQVQVLNYLLSDEAADLCRPEDETAFLDTDNASTLKSFTSGVLTPFEELVCAVVLSRPISHRLGMRTIRTLFSAPYTFTTPQSFTDAGKDKIRKAMDDAVTQHKDKTTDQLLLLAEVVAEKFVDEPHDTSLDKLRESRDWDTERDLLQKNIKGLGSRGLDIFCRRTQWRFEEFFPFVDEYTARGIERLGLGLPKQADQLFKVLEEHWDELDTQYIAGDDEKAKRRRAFVVLCDRASDAYLEGVTEDVLSAAASF